MPEARPSEEVKKEIESWRKKIEEAEAQITWCRHELDVAYRKEGRGKGRPRGPRKPKPEQNNPNV